MQVTGSIRIPFVVNGVDGKDGADGVDGITWSVPSSLIMPAGETKVQFNVGAYRDGSQLITDASQIIVRQTPTGASGCSIVSVDGSYGATMQLTRSEVTTDVNGELIIFTTVEGVQYISRVQVSSVFDGVGATVYPENVTFRETRNKVTAYVIVTDGDERVSASAWSMSVPSAPTGVTATVTDGDTYRQIDFERTDTSASIDSDYNLTIIYGSLTFERTIHIMSIENGVDGIMWGVPAIVSFAPDATYLSFYVGAWRDGKQLVTAISQIKMPTEVGEGITGVAPRAVDEEQGVLCEVIRSASAEINWTGVWSVTIEGNTYTFSVTVISVKNGTDGAKGTDGTNGTNGKDGADALFYSMEASASAITYYPARKAFAPETLIFSGYETRGTTTSPIDELTYWYVEQVRASDGTAVGYWTQGSSIEVLPEVTDFIATSITVTMCMHQDLNEAYDGCRWTVTVNTYCQPRILVWEDQADGFQFEGGAVGDSYIDTVIYGGEGSNVQRNMYQCLHTHRKNTDDDEPTKGTKSAYYWQQVNWFDNVATNLLLANYAYIKNLVADDVYMETDDGKTAIWINPALEGMLIRKMDTKYITGRENQTAATWSNPTTAFTARELPELEDIYDRAEFSGAMEDGMRTTISGSSGDQSNTTLTNIGTLSLEEALTANSTVRMTVDTDLSVAIKEGTPSGTTAYEHSQIGLELRCATSSTSDLTTEGKYRTLWTWTANGSGVSGETATLTKSGKVDVTFETEATDLYVRLYQTSYTMRGGSDGSIVVSGTFGVNGYCVVSNYVSQYTAGGAFIGLSSQDYLRVGMNTTGEAQHTLLAGGNGVDLTTEGCFQYKNGGRLPFAYALLSGYFAPNGNILSGDYWTFDDAGLASYEYRGTGYYVFTLPATWESTHGFELTTGKNLHISATVHRDNSSTGAYAKVNNITNRVISITTHDADGTMADFPFYLRIDYFPTNKSVTTTKRS